MPAAGPRIGEAAGATWDAMDLDAGTVEVRVVRLEGVGLSIKWRPKSRSGYRTLELPGWAVEMLRRRREKARANEWSVVFTAPLGGLRDPSNTQADLRVVFADAGHPCDLARLPQDRGDADGRGTSAGRSYGRAPPKCCRSSIATQSRRKVRVKRGLILVRSPGQAADVG
jgi:integrase